MRLHVLLNPSSAGGASLRRWRSLEPLARELFPGHLVHSSRQAGELIRIAAELAPTDGVLLAAGGDGTSHEVINGLAAGAHTRAALGWLPLGSGNDLARAMSVPFDPRLALLSYREPIFDTIDLGRIEYRMIGGEPAHKVFGNSFTIGVSADVLRLVARLGKPLGGKASYFLATVLALAKHRLAPVTIDGERDHYRLVAISNGGSFGAGMRIIPTAVLDDGQLDLVTFGGISRIGTAALFPSIYWAGHLRHQAVRHRRGATVEIDADQPLAFEADGELFEGLPPFRITVLPSALRVARPNPRAVDSKL